MTESNKQHWIWLDDVRPADTSVYTDVARNFTEFRELVGRISAAGEQIRYVSFDYVLDEFPDKNWPRPHEKQGDSCADFLVHCIWGDEDLLTEDFAYEAHSSDSGFNDRIHKRMAMIERNRR